MATLSLAGLVLLVVTATALAVTGDLTQPAGTAGCISQYGEGPCADGHGLAGPSGVAVSPDVKNVYVASMDTAVGPEGDESAVARLNRNTTTGAISQPAGTAGCISETGSGPCADGHALGGASSVAVSPDGKNVYVASSTPYAVARLNRNTTTGAISQPAGTAGCISEYGDGPCADGHGLTLPWSVAVSPDGKSVYVASFGAVARLNRNTTTGAITQPAGTAGCISDTGAGGCADGHGLGFPSGVTVSPDSKNVYVASGTAVARFNRNTTTGAITQPAGTAGCVSEEGEGPCTNGHALDGAQSVAVSPDGKNIYVASDVSDAVARFNRNTTTGAITQPADFPGCISESGAGRCRDGHGLNAAMAVAVSPDGENVYVGSRVSYAVARLDRDITGGINQPAGARGCISETGAGGCADGHGLNGANLWSVTVAPDGRSVYTATGGAAVARFNRAP